LGRALYFVLISKTGLPRMYAFDTDLLPLCAEFTLSHSCKVQGQVHEELQTSARTSLVTALRMLRLQRAILVTGMFSLFEALLQGEMGWTEPFKQLKENLKQPRDLELATFGDYQLAINVLKHGVGRSYHQLLARSPKLKFKIKPEGESFFHEGDVSEVNVLIDVDEQFVRQCAALIQETSSIIRLKRTASAPEPIGDR
jgi:hypothetical protein